MATETTAEAIASKRKLELNEHDKRKRRKRDRTPAKPNASKEQSSKSELVVRQNGTTGHADREEGMALDSVNLDNQTDQLDEHKQRPNVQNGAIKDNICKWSVSKPVGGRMLDIDPILTDDERHLILAYNTSLQVYSAPDSLLIRKIQLPLSRVGGRRDQIVAVCLSTTSPNLIWVASYGGLIWVIDWTTGAVPKAQPASHCSRLYDMFIDSVKIGAKVKEILYTSAETKRQTGRIVAHDVQDSKLIESKIIFTHTTAVENLRVSHNGDILAAYAGRDIIIGYRSQDAAPSFEDLAYEVVTLDASDDITCLDLQVSPRVHTNRRSQREAGDAPIVDLAIGCARGAIFTYNDLLPHFRLLNTPQARHHNLQPRKHHWHRKAVHAVKWSRDGNYILSGGSESTLATWQLDTQKMDFLPHLSAVIENIVVSKTGASYVLHLDDNSALVLSTAEMEPTTYISGIQALLSPRPISKDDSVTRIGQYTTDRLTSIPAAMSPSNPSQLLLCVGNGQRPSYSGSGPSMPLIQALDLTTMQSVSKQALTRTNPTDVNVTPRGHPITEPRVTNMKYSYDGQWLVTTDEWQPPTRDINSLEGLPSDRREIYLKFWSVSAENQSLELMTRIDAPHHSNQVEPVFGLAADPKSDRFATVGGDGMARLWQPTIRQRDGLLIKGKKGRSLYNWSCSQVISLYGNETTGDADVPDELFQGSGAVAFSEDGSVLVCAVAHEHGTIVQVIDTESGQIRNSLNGLIQGRVQGICVLSTNLVVLSDVLMVYDLVLDELRYGVELRKAKGSETDEAHGPGASVMTHLAADIQTSRFAVAVSRGKKGSRKVSSELAIFGPDGCEAELVKEFPNPITSLIPSVGSGGFLVLDSAAQLWSVAESLDTKSLTFAQPLADFQLDQEPIENGRVTINTQAFLLEEDDERGDDDQVDVDMVDAADGDAIYPAVVAPQKLAELFDVAPAFAMPPVEDMFYQVAKMFSTKSVTSAT